MPSGKQKKQWLQQKRANEREKQQQEEAAASGHPAPDAVNEPNKQQQIAAAAGPPPRRPGAFPAPLQRPFLRRLSERCSCFEAYADAKQCPLQADSAGETALNKETGPAT